MCIACLMPVGLFTKVFSIQYTLMPVSPSEAHRRDKYTCAYAHTYMILLFVSFVTVEFCSVVNASHFHYPFICWWSSWLFPNSGCYQLSRNVHRWASVSAVEALGCVSSTSTARSWVDLSTPWFLRHRHADGHGGQGSVTAECSP